VDRDGRRVRVGAGALNDRVSRHAGPCGLHFAPDPSSQSASTIGGNIAENAGGPHCLRHGVTLSHLRGLAWIDAAGETWGTGPAAPAARGIDLTSLLCGSEGTLGVVVAADLNLVPTPAAEVTLLAEFPRFATAAAAVIRVLGGGLQPVAVEMVDRPMLEAVEAAFAFGFPTDVGAVMIAEFAGGPAAVAEDGERARAILREAGARAVRLTGDPDERARLWTCRKKAFGAVGRLAPRYVSMDVVVPLGALPAIVERIQAVAAAHDVEIATTFHAGDGNLHPGVHYDDRDPELARRAHAAADAIIREALALGGSVTGEHGVGVEKLHVLPWQLDARAAGLMAGVKAAFDPGGLLNPGKALPDLDREWASPPPVPAAVAPAWHDLTVTMPADADLGAIQREALARGFWIPVGGVRGQDAAGPGLGTLPAAGTAVDLLLVGPALGGGMTLRDALLEVWAEDGEGHPFHAGAPVFKNVAGYNLPQLLVGAGGVLATVRALTCKLAPCPPHAAWWAFTGDVAAAWPALAPLLAARDGEATPTAVADIAAGRLWVLTPGRDRSWDLGDWGVELTAAATRAGLDVAARADLPFVDVAAALTEVLPGWAQANPDWTVATAADGGPCAWPYPASRWIWQARPRLLWLPTVSVPASGVHADVVWRDGRPTELPEPPADVPRPLLRRLKTVFDPGGNLPCPAWLGAGGDGS
jgi:FAD/FMN-containing dehydrogenase